MRRAVPPFEPMPEPPLEPADPGDRDCTECGSVFEQARNPLDRECNASIEGSSETAHCISCCAASEDRALQLQCDCAADAYEVMYYGAGAA